MSGAARSVVLHGHFYQPPREDPRTERVPLQPSAAPFHDWNERITEECYRPLTRVPVGREGASAFEGVAAPATWNLLEWMSFDAGPTLLSWLDREARDVHDAILAADRAARARTGGYGNAMAMAYHHSILPLASPRDKRTEVRWGIVDFRRRFGRDPVGMWLPETAVDAATMSVLAEEGIRFTVLAPHQVDGAPDDGTPGRIRTSSGREIAVFVYDGPLSHGVAFGGLLHDVDAWEHALVEGERKCVTFATDGETFGHHHSGGIAMLAQLIDRLRTREDIAIRNYEWVLAHHPPTRDLVLIDPSSWSCAHGVERWRSECGCKLSPERPSQQAWRVPLRQAMTELAEGVHAVYEEEGSELFRDPWGTRDRYGSLAVGDEDATRAFLDRELLDPEGADRARARALLEAERNALRLFTSCAWFFDDLARIEPIQILTYAARAIDLLGPAGGALEEALLRTLEEAQSNDPTEGNGRTVYETHVRGARAEGPDSLRNSGLDG